MQRRNPSPPPRRDDESKSFVASIRQTARTTAGPVLLVWMAISIGEFLLAEWLASGISHIRIGPWWDVPLDPRAWAAAPLVALILPFLAAFRTALFLPARRAYQGDSPTIGSTLEAAFERMFPVLSVRITIEALQIGVLLLCIFMVVRMPLWVVLPLGFTLAPALYFAAARQMDSNASLWEALKLSDKHWIAIFGAHGFGLIAILAFSSAGGMTEAFESLPVFPLNTFTNLKLLGAYLAGRYVDWLVVTATYLYLDEG